MKPKIGYHYFVSNEFFNKVTDPNLKQNKQLTKRPHYCAYIDDKTGLAWFVPCSMQIKKFVDIVNKKQQAGKSNNGIKIETVQGVNQAYLFQDMFPISENYIDSEQIRQKVHISIGNTKKVAEFEKNAKKVIKILKHGGKFTPTQPNVNKIEKLLLTEQADLLLHATYTSESVKHPNHTLLLQQDNEYIIIGNQTIKNAELLNLPTTLITTGIKPKDTIEILRIPQTDLADAIKLLSANQNVAVSRSSGGATALYPQLKTKGDVNMNDQQNLNQVTQEKTQATLGDYIDIYHQAAEKAEKALRDFWGSIDGIDKSKLDTAKIKRNTIELASKVCEVLIEQNSIRDLNIKLTSIYESSPSFEQYRDIPISQKTLENISEEELFKDAIEFELSSRFDYIYRDEIDSFPSVAEEFATVTEGIPQIDRIRDTIAESLAENLPIDQIKEAVGNTILIISAENAHADNIIKDAATEFFHSKKETDSNFIENVMNDNYNIAEIKNHWLTDENYYKIANKVSEKIEFNFSKKIDERLDDNELFNTTREFHKVEEIAETVVGEIVNDMVKAIQEKEQQYAPIGWNDKPAWIDENGKSKILVEDHANRFNDILYGEPEDFDDWYKAGFYKEKYGHSDVDYTKLESLADLGIDSENYTVKHERNNGNWYVGTINSNDKDIAFCYYTQYSPKVGDPKMAFGSDAHKNESLWQNMEEESRKLLPPFLTKFADKVIEEFQQQLYAEFQAKTANYNKESLQELGIDPNYKIKVDKKEISKDYKTGETDLINAEVGIINPNHSATLVKINIYPKYNRVRMLMGADASNSINAFRASDTDKLPFDADIDELMPALKGLVENINKAVNPSLDKQQQQTKVQQQVKIAQKSSQKVPQSKQNQLNQKVAKNEPTKSTKSTKNSWLGSKAKSNKENTKKKNNAR